MTPRYSPGDKVKIKPTAKEGLIKMTELRPLKSMTVVGTITMKGLLVVEIDCHAQLNNTHNINGKLKASTGYYVFEDDLEVSTYVPGNERAELDSLLDNFTANLK